MTVLMTSTVSTTGAATSPLLAGAVVAVCLAPQAVASRLMAIKMLNTKNSFRDMFLSSFRLFGFND